MTLAQLTASELECLMIAAPEATVIADADGRILLASHRVEEIYGYAFAELIGAPIAMLLPERLDSVAADLPNDARTVPESGPAFIGRRKDGSEFPLEINVSHVDGARRLTVATLRDVSQWRRREAELRAAYARSEAANRGKTQVLATASHDLRQPVQALRLLNGSLGDCVHEPALAELVSHQARAIGSMDELLMGLLDLSRLEAGMIKPRQAAFDIADMLRDLHQETAAQAVERGLTLEIDARPAPVRNDPGLVRQILRNLLSNAIKFTDRGSVRLACARDGNLVSVEIADTGPGIPDGARAQVFDEFFRVPREDGRTIDGHGLGLSIVRRLVDLLGLRLEWETQPGRGTRFRLELPALGRAVSPVAHAASRRCAAFDKPHPVLVIEDDAGLRHATRRWLEGRGLQVETAADVNEAGARIASGFRPELAICDLHLAHGASGLDAVQALRKALGAELQVLMLSGDSSVAARCAARAQGVSLLLKPVDPEDLLRAIRGALG
jgi:PAS domain S-box-containing protein